MPAGLTKVTVNWAKCRKMSEIRTKTTPIRREGRVDDWMHQKLRKNSVLRVTHQDPPSRKKRAASWWSPKLYSCCNQCRWYVNETFLLVRCDKVAQVNRQRKTRRIGLRVEHQIQSKRRVVTLVGTTSASPMTTSGSTSPADPPTSPSSGRIVVRR